MCIRSLRLSCSRLLKNRHAVCLCRTIRSRKGTELVEAAVSFPILILSAMLMLRMFVFCLEILSTGVHEHLAMLEAWDSYRGAGISGYSTEKDVGMLRGGILQMDVSKNISIRTYLINEDVLVRAGELLD